MATKSCDGVMFITISLKVNTIDKNKINIK